MSGTAVLRYLMANNAAMIAVVPAARIFSGRKIPLNTTLPALLVFTVSGTPLNLIRDAGHKRIITERVQVSGLAHNYVTAKSLLPLIMNAGMASRGTINGVVVQYVKLDFIHPDLDDQSMGEYILPSVGCDFYVRWEHTPS